eukprot:8235-Heterococcus_DN1.PRE.2
MSQSTRKLLKLERTALAVVKHATHPSKICQLLVAVQPCSHYIADDGAALGATVGAAVGACRAEARERQRRQYMCEISLPRHASHTAV